MASPFAILVLAAAVFAAVAGCGSGSPPDTTPSASTSSPAVTDHGWTLVDVAGPVNSMSQYFDDLVVAGNTSTGPFLAEVNDGLAQPITGFHGTAAREVAVNETGLVVTDQSQLAAPPVVWLGEYQQEESSRTWKQEQMRDEQGRTALWVSVVKDDEDETRTVGVMPGSSGAAPALHAWEIMYDWQRLDRGDQIFLPSITATSSLRTASSAATAVAAGTMTTRSDGSGATPQIWAVSDELMDFPDGRGRWERLPTASEPDGFTDIQSWAGGFWVAGHRHQRPVVYDFHSLADVRGTAGAELPVPAVRLDPKDPRVIVAGPPQQGDPMVLAIQSSHGPELWSGMVTSAERPSRPLPPSSVTWTKTELPPGHLTAARKTFSGGTYVVIDGKLWYRVFPGTQVPAPTP